MELVSSKTNFNFMGMGKYAFVFSALVIAASIYIWSSRGISKFGIDYVGGHEIIVKVSEGGSSGEIRKALEKQGIKNAVVQSFEAESGEFAIRLSGEAKKASEVMSALKAAMNETYPDKWEELGNIFVGPTIGKELQRNALIAILVGLIGILAYITYRFEFAFALGAVAALFHDVVVCLGVYLFLDRTLNMTTLAASLTIVGYSVNDTIIVFDRMREEIFKRKEFDLVELMNYSINHTLSRTVITSLLTLFSAVALLVFGGGAIKDLSIFLVVGVITGTYSTIFIASPVALLWENMVNPESKAEKTKA